MYLRGALIILKIKYMKVCKSDGCFKPAAPKRTICWACKSKEWRDKNPIPYVWHMLKKSAKKRGLPFTITVEYFTNFIKETNYMAERGRLLDSLNVDRMDNLRGYEPGNLKILTKSDNVKKYHHLDIKREKLVTEYTEEYAF